ncbi:hypothetical protein LV85_03439 [Algoriphagus chordae]|uniref:Uncharacterized protein n=1 Tax=Algoriphagus chordae TaxID=237019 RepID=A0A2W7R4B1_9BACT|nr:hypothetical protein LV85_03439 [Algoriphagus chordae]
MWIGVTVNCQFQIGKDIRVKLQTSPSLKYDFIATEETLRQPLIYTLDYFKFLE